VLGGETGQQPASGGGMLGSILGGILSGGGLGSILGGGQTADQVPQDQTTYDPQQSQTTYDPQQGGDVNAAPGSGDAGSLSVDETPAAPGEDPPQAQPQSSSSIVDEILGGLFGKN
jgi:hypothetical protein